MRLKEARIVGAEGIVSCCPDCKENFGRAIAATGDRIKVYDLSELLYESVK